MQTSFCSAQVRRQGARFGLGPQPCASQSATKSSADLVAPSNSGSGLVASALAPGVSNIQCFGSRLNRDAARSTSKQKATAVPHYNGHTSNRKSPPSASTSPSPERTRFGRRPGKNRIFVKGTCTSRTAPPNSSARSREMLKDTKLLSLSTRGPSTRRATARGDSAPSVPR
jgi:hypothetical protein